jgi:uncharacterized phiE125 gp8 family phage protein
VRPRTLKVLSWPESEPVTLSEARDQIGLLSTQTDFDSLLSGAISTARRVIEQRLGCSLIATQYRAKWNSGVTVLTLPAPPLLLDDDHTLSVTVGGVALLSSEYELDEDAKPATLTLDATATDEVVITYWGGATTAEEIEPQVKSAALMYVEHLFNHRGVMAETGQIEVPQGFEMLLAASSYSGGY